MAIEWFRSHHSQDFSLRLLSEITSSRQYNAPTVFEVAAQIVNYFGDGIPVRDIFMNKNNVGPQRISELHPSYMALQYRLLFPYGEDGFHEKKDYYVNEGTQKTKRGYITMKEYYAYIIQHRPNQGTTLLRGGRLLQQYLVDAFTAVEEQRLKWTRNNHDTLRNDLYHNLCDAVTRGDTSAAGLGKRILKERFKCTTPDEINDIISAELPSPAEDPYEYKVVSEFMLDEPCGKDVNYTPCTTEGNAQNITPREALDFDVNKSKVKHEQLHSLLNPEQRLVYDKDYNHETAIIPKDCACRGILRHVILYVTIVQLTPTLLLSNSVSLNELGIASLLLLDGRTTHRIFVTPLELVENNTCNIKQNTHLVELMQQVKLIIWDEAPMTQRYLRKCCKVLKVTRRMRVNEYSGNEEIDLQKQNFNTVGDEKLQTKKKETEDEPTWIKILEEFLIKSLSSPIERIALETYLDFTTRQTDESYLKERAILTPINDDADAINEFMFKKPGGVSMTYNSADKICKASTDTEDQHHLSRLSS
uniref:ATP-dependent DNA helicase n=1 Tax=Tanacetum cinerariifolium TaxID=118510 RepID=A0A699H5F2_TANCI|nr:hypothetical protein CTI12_AA123990 [Tanacetum cinerariifolium]